MSAASQDSPKLTGRARAAAVSSLSAPNAKSLLIPNGESLWPAGAADAESPLLYFQEKRHGRRWPANASASRDACPEWRIKERMKTVSVALTVCLNIGVDPPDVVKPQPCARLECWIDPFQLPPQKALENIGQHLQQQYELWQPRARYKPLLDPTAEELKKLCCALRRNAREDRVLLHYNGHGVPRPTASGEIWVFNKQYTQYIPVSLLDVLSWMGSPSMLVLDCSNAGILMEAYQKWSSTLQDRASPVAETGSPAMRRSQHSAASASSSYQSLTSLQNVIMLAACESNELLPVHPDLPADLFTACLTTPIDMALRYAYNHRRLLSSRLTMDMLSQLPGKLQDRRTLLGELNWIFTAITDTIAFTSLSPELFRRLFRQDLLVAALMRNFLLAQRIMRGWNCHPKTWPPVPDMTEHRLWKAWDLAVEECLSQLPDVILNEVPYEPLSFFAEQLTAFEVWLEYHPHLDTEPTNPPEQLPIVLQVLLSQTHRLRALVVLGRFLDLGPWAAHQALAVGIFPYVLKLLQSPAIELKLVLVFIWARILAIDQSCQQDLLKENGYQYFINILLSKNPLQTSGTPSPVTKTATDLHHPSSADSNNVSEIHAMCAFIIAQFCRDFPQGQKACCHSNLLPGCLHYLNDEDPLLRQWIILCIGQLWHQNVEVQLQAMKLGIVDKIYLLLTDPVPEVRASAILALSQFLAYVDSSSNSDERQIICQNIGVTLLICTLDASPLVRKEFVVALSHCVASNPRAFVLTAYFMHRQSSEEAGDKAKDKQLPNGSPSIQPDQIPDFSYYQCLWKVLLNSCMDGVESVRQKAKLTVDWVMTQVVLAHPELLYTSSRKSVPEPRPIPANVARQKYGLSPSSSTGSLSGTHLRRIGSYGHSTWRSSRDSGGHSFTPHQTGRRPVSAIFSADLVSAAATPPSLPETHVDPETPEENKEEILEMPLISDYFEWSCHFFREPRLRVNDEDQPGGQLYWNRRYRKKQIWSLWQEAEMEYSSLEHRRWEEYQLIDVSSNAAAGPQLGISQVVLHSFDPILVVADTRNDIHVWNWEQQSFVNYFPSTPRKLGGKVRITGIHFINEQDSSSLLLTGTDDGLVSIHDGIVSDCPTTLTTWRALDLIPDETSPGLQLCYQQMNGTVIAAGDHRLVKIWDLEKELCVQELPVKSAVTVLSADPFNPHLVFSGYQTGHIKIIDRRLGRDSNAVVFDTMEHQDWVVGLHLQRGMDRLLVSASTEGDVRFWDSRFANRSIKTLQIDPTRQLSCFDAHDYTGLFACGSESQQLFLCNMATSSAAIFKYHDGFLGNRLPPLTSLDFHPLRSMIAVGGEDSFVSLFRSIQ